jgi:hypothetical protein
MCVCIRMFVCVCEALLMSKLKRCSSRITLHLFRVGKIRKSRCMQTLLFVRGIDLNATLKFTQP